MLSKAKEVGRLALTTTALEDTGVFSWLWAKTSEHVATRAIDTSVSVEVGPPGATFALLHKISAATSVAVSSCRAPEGRPSPHSTKFRGTNRREPLCVFFPSPFF